MRKRIKKKIADLHEQPEHVRHRAASLFAIGSGIIIVVLWLAVLLPLQLRFQPGAGKDKATPQEAVVAQEPEQALPVNSTSQVGGAQDIAQTATPTPIRQIQQSPQAIISPTEAPEETKPVAIEELVESPSP